MKRCVLADSSGISVRNSPCLPQAETQAIAAFKELAVKLNESAFKPLFVVSMAGHSLRNLVRFPILLFFWKSANAPSSTPSYNLMSKCYFTHTSPTLFNAGAPNPPHASLSP